MNSFAGNLYQFVDVVYKFIFEILIEILPFCEHLTLDLRTKMTKAKGFFYVRDKFSPNKNLFVLLI